MPKIIITAEKERLDKELTIAQMQGRFKLTVIHNVGHSVQEDDYHGTAKVLHEFMFLFRIAQTSAEEAKRTRRSRQVPSGGSLMSDLCSLTRLL